MPNAVISINERAGLLKLNGTICQEAAMDFRERLDLLVRYYQHRHLTLHINSNGGEVGSLRYMLDGMRLHRQDGITFATVASFSACSAAAVLLASGEPRRRSVSRQSSLLFHHSRQRIEPGQMITADGALRLAGMLSQVDAAFEQAIVAHLTEGFGDIVSLAEEGEARCRLVQARADDLVQQQVALEAGRLFTAAENMQTMWASCLDRRSAEPYTAFLRSRFATDDWMELVDAYALVLIDTVDQVPALLPQAAHQPQSPPHQRLVA
ncbi:ATP-dependent Clp protease proteolytic subunit [Massilia sp. LXY-6]|uniref:ATP-dependent Clp protease proteolytic subunit n=1 Tax=Massilia sp. LXY-6 TaxID=3379823 RepID=UPI003EE17ACA